MRAEKIQIVNDIGNLMSDSKYVFFVSYKGLTVKEMSDFRISLSQSASECHVFKNRLVRKAAEFKNMKGVSELSLKDDTAVITGSGDAGLVAKVIADFAKNHNQLSPKCGYFDGTVLSASDINEISALPPKNVIRAQLLGILQAPARNLASILYSKTCQIVNLLNNYKDKKEGN